MQLATAPRKLNPYPLRTYLAIVLACWAAPATATGYHINVFSDDDDINGNCTLREALWAAQSDQPRDACPAGTASDRIVLDRVGTYIFSQGEFASRHHGTIVVEGPTPGARDAMITLGFNNRFLNHSGTGSVVLRDLVIGFGATETAGGALRFTSGDLTLDNVGMVFNQARNSGGALYWDEAHAQPTSGDGRLVIADSDFVGNLVTGIGEAPRGGAIWASPIGMSRIEIVRTVFDGNGGRSAGGAPGLAMGGAVFIDMIHDAEARITDSLFTGNSLVLPWGGFGQGTAVYVDASSTSFALLRDNVFVDNFGHLGDPPQGGTASAAYLRTHQSTARIEADRNRFHGNDLDPTGWAIGRQLNVEGRGIARVTNTLATGGDVGVRVKVEDIGRVTLAHVTATGNEVGVSIVEELVGWAGGTTRLINSIVALNASEDLVIDGTLDQVANLVGVDPLFVDPGNEDFRLQAVSPAIDAADSTEASWLRYDLARSPRIVGPESDVGAYEWKRICPHGQCDGPGRP